jgi:hypothetical protein
MKIQNNLKALGLIGVVILFGGLAFLPIRAVAVEESTQSSYNSDIAFKLTSRCDLVKDYLSQTARINELAARQNKVRGWEYILRQLSESKPKYEKFNVDYSELASAVQSLKLQLEQFKVDFENYDLAFDKLVKSDCVRQPEIFWRQLETLRSFRAGVSLASENFKSSLGQTIAREELKW